jgi:predicted PurR-regulated permease PerM
MSDNDLRTAFLNLQKPVLEMAIKLGVIFILVFWCFRIVEPFVLLMCWGIIVAIALHPIFLKLRSILGGSSKLSATLLVLILVSSLIIPTIMLTESLVEGAQTLAHAGESGDLQIPPPPPEVAEWPLVGTRTHDLWRRAATNFSSVAKEFSPQIKLIGAWTVETVTGTGLGILQFIASFIISGILLASADKWSLAANAFAARLAPTRGPEFTMLTSSTIRNVALGIVGVSILQASLLTLGFLLIGLPAAGLAALIALVLCIIQVGPGLVSIGAIIWAFMNLETAPASVFMVWTLAVTICDSFLKPLVFSRGAVVPTLVIFLGAIGGMVAYGIIGLFIGAVVLSLGYKLYEAWLKETPMRDTDQPDAPAQEPEALEADYNV